MEREKSTQIHQGSEKDVEVLQKVVRPEGEMEISVGDDVKKKIYWVRSGFESRVYYNAYFKKKLKETIEMGILSKNYIKKTPIGIVDGNNSAFFVEPHSIVDGSIKVYKGSTLCKSEEYSYNSELRVLFFYKPPKQPITVEFEYYDQEVWDEVYNNSISCMLIYISAREIDDHSKKVFKSPDDVGTLTQIEVNETLSVYMEKFKVGDSDLKNLLTSPQSEADSDLPNDIDSTPLEASFGETLEDKTK